MPDSIEDYVDENNSVRVIDAYIGNLNLDKLGFVRAEPNNTGRPMYDPQDMLKLYVYGYMNRIRSSRRLETETKRNLEVIWLMKKLSPDHKTISRFRHDNTNALKNVFKDFVKLCLKLGLYGKELVAIDGSKFKAVNSKDRNFTDKKLEERIARIDVKIEEYLHQLEESDSKEDAASGEKTSEEISKIITELAIRKSRYEAYADELKQNGETQKSLTDPDSRLMMANGKLDVCYNVQTAVDSKNKMIVDFDVTNSAVDKNQLTPMAERAAEMFETKQLSAVADTGYDSVQDIVKCVEQGIAPHVAGTDFDICLPSEITPEEIVAHTNGRCVYNSERNVVLCPMGKVLYPGFFKKTKGMGVFYNFKERGKCTCKRTTEKRGRRHQVPMKESDFSKEYNDENLKVKQLRIAPDKKTVKEQKSIVEHPFGILKRNMDSGYCLTKGLGNVCGEFSLAFLAFNLKRVINILGTSKLIEVVQG
jgi:transposase